MVNHSPSGGALGKIILWSSLAIALVITVASGGDFHRKTAP